MENNYPDKRYLELAEKWLNGNSTIEEQQEFMSWYNNVVEEQPVLIPGAFAQDEETHRLRILDAIRLKNRERTVKPFQRKLSRLWYAAASVLLLLGIGYLFMVDRETPPDRIVKTNKGKPGDMAAPDSTHAILFLQNGKQIILDSVQNGQLAMQGNVQVVKLADGKIAYQAASGHDDDIQYNTLTVPRGSRLAQLELADGSTVVLNAASSITYPTAFAGSERKVEITGEAYFEVTKNPSKRFVVIANGITTEVLGTHFNVNAYDDEEAVKVTLVEGKVKVSGEWSVVGKKSATLQPGQQAVITHNSQLTTQNVDTDEAIAWKNGLFQFNSLTIEQIMRQISRWYDIDVVYETSSPKHFSGIVSRNSNVSEVLKVLEQAGIKCKVEGRTITVLQ